MYNLSCNRVTSGIYVLMCGHTAVQMHFCFVNYYFFIYLIIHLSIYLLIYFIELLELLWLLRL